MRLIALLGIAALALGACVSTQMKTLVGEPVQEALIRYGKPENVIDMPDGSRAYQFRYGGGELFVPGSATTTVYSAGNMATASTTGTPARTVEVAGCLLTFIARQHGDTWIIESYRVPPGIVCGG